jgi:hypothetical protein
MQGYFTSAPTANSNQTNLFLEFQYGLAAPPTAAASGIADYQMNFTGKEFTFRADYGAKIITGAVPFYTNGPTQISQFRDVTISADGTGFGGRLIPPNGSAEGTVQGLFMGPSGEEFLAQAVLPGGPSIMLFSGARAT